MNGAQYLNARGIVERIVVTGELVLDTPTHLGSGDADGPLDLALLVDPLEGRALLTGASLAGGLRHYVELHSLALADALFGRVSNAAGEETSVESAMIVDDALGEVPDVELRDGVAIDAKKRSAEEKKKFDMELLAEGTRFPLSLELLVLKGHEEELRTALALALEGLQRGKIRLGKRKRRGLGQCHVAEWAMTRYDVTQPQGLVAWLEQDRSGAQPVADVAQALGVQLPQAARSACILEGDFAIVDSMLIRSGAGEPDAPDMVHLRSRRKGQDERIVSGTAVAGALRARTVRIGNTLGLNGYDLADQLFGLRPRKETKGQELTASKIWVEEAVIDNPLDLVHTRLKVDRFTGGAYAAALFSQEPAYARGETSTVRLRLELDDPQPAEVGLLLLLLKDLWTEDLRIGGESNVGRGRLAGQRATLDYGGKRWHFMRVGKKGLTVDGDGAALQTYVDALTGGAS
ncbi:MAG: hypothetical protein GXY76_14215 [Chloroflexi bacterium]|nr:hypothetical protein [Chloroflexota bacterium]